VKEKWIKSEVRNYKMNKYRIVFSPTGGTEKVTNTITKFWNEVKDIDLSKTDLDFSSISFTKKT